MINSHELEAEFCMVGALIVEPSLHGIIASHITPEDIGNPMLRAMYSRIVDMIQTGEPVDAVAILDRTADLTAKREDMRRYITELMTASSAPAIVEHHARMVQKESKRRKIAEIVSEKFRDGILDPDEEIEDIIGRLHGIGLGRETGGKSMLALLTEFAEWYSNPDAEKKIHTGQWRLDHTLGGLRPGQLVMIAARPSVGKSAFAGNLALDTAKKGIPVALFSCEMSGLELVKRFIAREADEDLHNIERRQITRGGGVAASLNALPLTVYDKPGISVSDIRLECKRRGNLGLVVIDYLQLLHTVSKGENRNLEVAAMTRELKMLARELHVPIVLLSQLNRAKDETQEPSLSDFRDSGAIEQDADVCIFLWRLEIREDNEVQKIGVKVGKNRGGRIGTVVMNFYGATMRHEETDEKYKPDSYRPRQRTSRYELPDIEGV